MPRRLIYAIVFIEGFCSLGAEVIGAAPAGPAHRQRVVITAPTIGSSCSRWASATRPAAGRRRLPRIVPQFPGFRGTRRHRAVRPRGRCAVRPPAAGAVRVAALRPRHPVPGRLVLGQTVPILTNLLQHERAGEASGAALYWSTLGSFLGSLGLSLLVMQWLGVSAAVFACAAGLLAGTLMLSGRDAKIAVLALSTATVAGYANLQHAVTADTAYAEYRVAAVDRPGQTNPRAFWVNQSAASLIDESDPPRYTRYIEHLRRVLLDDLGFRDRDILVLGAGGFTLSHREPENRYTYVDIDPQIRAIAERHFLKSPARGEFVADDARRYVATTVRRFDAVVVDVFGSHTSIPSHLVTREFWDGLRRVLKPDGVLLANLILDGKLESPYARNLLATIESVYGRCAGSTVLHKAKPLANVEVACFASSRPAPAGI
jgi:SAM-dependent methyltransferase